MLEKLYVFKFFLYNPASRLENIVTKNPSANIIFTKKEGDSMFQDFNSYNQFYGINNGGNIMADANWPNNQEINFQRNLSNGFDMRQQVSNNNIELISINQAINMIRKCINDYGNEELFYSELIKNISNEKVLSIVKDIRDDDRRHNRLLKEVYSNLTGQMVPMDNYQSSFDDKSDKKDNDISEQLEILLFDKLDNVEKFRKILGVMPSGENYTLVFAILTDELKNSSKINYLIHINK